MRSWLVALGIGLAGVLVGALLVWWLASTDTSFSQRWLTLALMLPLGGVYFGWDQAKKREVASPQAQNLLTTRISYVLMGAFLAALSQHFTFVIASGIWHADAVDPAQSDFLYQLFNPGSLPSLSDTRSGGSSTESGWLEMVLVGVFVGTVMTFYITKKPRQ